MSSLVRVHLGSASASGKKAVDTSCSFKGAIREAIGREPEQCWMVIVTDRERLTCGVEACFYRGEAEAEKWVARAKEIAPEVWKSVGKQRARGVA